MQISCKFVIVIYSPKKPAMVAERSKSLTNISQLIYETDGSDHQTSLEEISVFQYVSSYFLELERNER